MQSTLVKRYDTQAKWHHREEDTVVKITVQNDVLWFYRFEAWNTLRLGFEKHTYHIGEAIFDEDSKSDAVSTRLGIRNTFLLLKSVKYGHARTLRIN